MRGGRRKAVGGRICRRLKGIELWCGGGGNRGDGGSSGSGSGGDSGDGVKIVIMHMHNFYAPPPPTGLLHPGDIFNSPLSLSLSLSPFPSTSRLLFYTLVHSPLSMFLVTPFLLSFPAPCLMGTTAFFPIRRPFSLFGARKCPARGSDMRQEP